MARVLTVLLAVSTMAGLVPFLPHASAATTSVATTTNAYGLGLGYSGYTCGANGYYWVFFNNGQNWAYTSSPNGNTWGTPQTIATSVPNPMGTSLMGFFCQGNTVYYAGGKGSTTANNFYFNSGSLGTNGLVTWGTEQSVSTNFASVQYPSLAVDAYGHVWVVVQTSPSGSAAATFLEVWEQTQPQSTTWTESNQVTGQGEIAEIVPLSSGNMGLAIGGSNEPITVRYFNGVDWSPPAVTTVNSYDIQRSSASAIGNTLELCTTDYNNVYYFPFVFGNTSPPQPFTLSTQAISCSMTTDGAATLVAYYAAASGSEIEESTSVSSGATWVPGVVSNSESHVTAISAAFAVSTNPSKQAVAVWLSSAAPYQVRFANVPAQIFVTEQVTITPAISSGTTASATVSGCQASVSSIPMDGLPHTFSAGVSCALTLSVPTDGQSSRYRFGGGSETWTYTTGTIGTDVMSKTVYQQYLASISYSMAGGSGTPPAPTLFSTQVGQAYSSTIGTTTQPGCCWLDYGQAWFVPPTLSVGSGFWTTTQTTSGTVTGPLTLAYVYNSVILTTTSTTTTTTTITQSTTITSSIAATTVTNTVISPTTITTSVTQTQTATVTEGSVPTGDYLTCDQTYLNLNQKTNCHATISPADEGPLQIGTVAWHSTGGTFQQMQCNNPNDQGQVQCQVQFTPTAAGVQNVSEKFSGDAYHGASAAAFLIYVTPSPAPAPPSPNQGVSGSSVTSTVVWCDQTYLNLNGPGPGPGPAPPPQGQNTNCHATVSNSDGSPVTGTVTWAISGGGTLATNPPPPNCNKPNGQGQIQCQIQVQSTTAGEWTVTGTYSGASGHTASAGSFVVFVIPNNNPIAEISAAVWGALRALSAGVASFGQPVALMAGSAIAVLGLKGRGRLGRSSRVGQILTCLGT